MTPKKYQEIIEAKNREIQILYSTLKDLGDENDKLERQLHYYKTTFGAPEEKQNKVKLPSTRRF